MNSVHKGNLIGIGALILWGTLVALIKSVSEAFGVAGGTALIYTIGAIAGFILNGIPKISLMPKKYLFLAGSVFVLYEIVFSQAIAVSESSVQTLEVGMINYLWPCLTVLFSIWINGVKMRPIVWPGVIITVCGLYLCAAANSELNFFNFINNLAASPVPYILGLAAAVTWGLYSNLSVRYSSGANGVPLFFAAVAVFLWIKFFMGENQLYFPGIWSFVQLIFLGIVLSLSYVMWEKGIHDGNFIFLAVCSYFTPALSMLFAAVWLKTAPPFEYWIGVGLVIIGSLVCWLANYKR